MPGASHSLYPRGCAILSLDDVLARLATLPQQEQNAIREVISGQIKASWVPNPGPQTEAFFSLADLLLYGGQGGGGKSDLIAGLALTAHKNSLIMRRQYTDLGAIIERVLTIHGSRQGFNGSPPPKLRASVDRLIEFGAAAKLMDVQHWQGQAHDLLALDEAVQFLEAQVRFLMGWVRPRNEADANLRCRTVLASNPPMSSDGDWVIGMFRPWLDVTHPKPAAPGELRWFVTDPDGKDLEVAGADDIKEWKVDGQSAVFIPKSRTFIPAKLSDNPTLVRTGYQATLDAMPEPMRSAIRDGNFMAARKDHPDQIIPTAWVLAAKSRWTAFPPNGIPMCALGVDASGGGDDPMVIAPRHDGWYAYPIVIPGKDIPPLRIGGFCAGMVVSYRRDDAAVVLDMGGGYGGPILERLTENGVPVMAYKGAESSLERTKDRKLAFVNKRTASLWRFREALDPDQDGGSPIMLPDDPELVADLTAPTFEETPRGIKAESKEDVCARLGRSTDKGDAVVMAWTAGLKQMNTIGGYSPRDQRMGKRDRPMKVITGRKRR